MPKNTVSDPITDQELAFARLVLSGAMTDRQAAESVGLNPDSAAYTKSKPRVRDYMVEHRAAVRQQLVQQEADGQRLLNLDREQVLKRLWELAHLSPEMTRSSITGQVKAISMIVAMLNLIPDHRATPNFVRAEPRDLPLPKRKSMPPPGVGRPQPSTRSQAPPLPSKMRNRVFPISLPHRWQRRLPTLVPASPPTASALRNHRHRPMSPCSLLLRTPEFLFL
jgi:hypothetical protein